MSVNHAYDPKSYRDHFQKNYPSDASYDAFEPAYRHGFDAAQNPIYQGKDWSTTEPDLHRDWDKKGTNITWGKVKGAVEHAWNKVTGKA